MRYFELTTESKVISVLRFNHQSKSVREKRMVGISGGISTTNVTIGTHDQLGLQWGTISTASCRISS